MSKIIMGDCLEEMRKLPTGCADLCFTSPPYGKQRTYGIGFKYTNQAWVDWMIPRVLEMCRVTNGLVFVNAAGAVEDFQYQPIVEWLVADLTRLHGIVCGPAPYVFHRIGIPGSGGPHYHRRDWEPVYAFALEKNLPPKWSDNTAFGHPPKWAPGGEMSNRLSDGSRVNQWGHSADSGATVVDPGGVVRSKGKRPSHVVVNGRDQWGGTPHASGGEGRHANGKHKTKLTKAEKLAMGAKSHTKRDTDVQANGEEMREQAYLPPAIANPGNVVSRTYTTAEVCRLLDSHGDIVHCKVGGGLMGSKLAHKNEAPFPESLVRKFIAWFCPPGGTVMDCFGGSGTVPDVAKQEGRNFIAIDVRQSQIDLIKARTAQEMLL